MIASSDCFATACACWEVVDAPGLAAACAEGGVRASAGAVADAREGNDADTDWSEGGAGEGYG